MLMLLAAARKQTDEGEPIDADNGNQYSGRRDSVRGLVAGANTWAGARQAHSIG